jgi:Ca-activated chloride channel family protein
MLELAHPWFLLLLALPPLLWMLLPPYKRAQRAVQLPFMREAAAKLGIEPRRGAVVLQRPVWQVAGSWLGWSLFVLALARPQWLEEPVVRTLAGRDLMLAVDLSGSMDTEDFTAADGTRLRRVDAVKRVLDGFVERREHDRIGLIVFGNAPYLQVPFTQDHATCRYLLSEADVPMAGPQTMLGDAIGFAITRFEQSESANRVLILLTDGNDTGSKMPPVKASAIAAKRGITIHTIAAGDPEAAGEARMDEETLQEISKNTGGRFFRAQDRAALEDVYRELDKLEAGEFETTSFRPRRELYMWPVGFGLVLLLAYHAVLALVTRG